MVFSLDYEGTYTEHREFFDLFAKAMQAKDHEVGIIAGVRESEAEKFELGFIPNFVRVWGQQEDITNASQWKVNQINALGVMMHFDDDATELKKWTDRWIMKTLNSNQKGKF